MTYTKFHTHVLIGSAVILLTVLGRTDIRTDGQTDGQTDGRTHPLIESLHATKNFNPGY